MWKVTPRSSAVFIASRMAAVACAQQRSLSRPSSPWRMTPVIAPPTSAPPPPAIRCISLAFSARARRCAMPRRRSSSESELMSCFGPSPAM